MFVALMAIAPTRFWFDAITSGWQIPPTHVDPKQPCPHVPQFDGSVMRFAPPHGPPEELDAVVLLEDDELADVVLVDDVEVELSPELVLDVEVVDDVVVDDELADAWLDVEPAEAWWELDPPPAPPVLTSMLAPAAHAAATTVTGSATSKTVQRFIVQSVSEVEPRRRSTPCCPSICCGCCSSETRSSSRGSSRCGRWCGTRSRHR
jgi:hypothetical protein